MKDTINLSDYCTHGNSDSEAQFKDRPPSAEYLKGLHLWNLELWLVAYSL